MSLQNVIMSDRIATGFCFTVNDLINSYSQIKAPQRCKVCIKRPPSQESSKKRRKHFMVDPDDDEDIDIEL